MRIINQLMQCFVGDVIRKRALSAFLLIALITVFSPQAKAQGAAIVGQAINQQGFPVPFAPVRVCLSTASGLPCTPTTLIYSDVGLTVPLPNPTATDQYGNYNIFVPQGTYIVQITISPSVFYSFIVTPGSGASPGGGVVPSTARIVGQYCGTSGSSTNICGVSGAGFDAGTGTRFTAKAVGQAFNPMAYSVTNCPSGADPSGASDSTACIQAAINDACASAGPTSIGKVLIPSGTFSITLSSQDPMLSSGNITNPYYIGMLVVPCSYIDISGAGAGNTILSATYNGANPDVPCLPVDILGNLNRGSAFYIPPNTTGDSIRHSVTIHDMTITGNRANAGLATNGLAFISALTPASGLTPTECGKWWDTTNKGLLYANNGTISGLHVYNMEFKNWGGECTYGGFPTTNGLDFEENWIHNCGGDGISNNGAGKFHDNIIDNIAASGFENGSVGDQTIQNNIITNAFQGIVITPGSNDLGVLYYPIQSMTGSAGLITLNMFSGFTPYFTVGNTVQIQRASPSAFNGTYIVNTVVGSTVTLSGSATGTATTDGYLVFSTGNRAASWVLQGNTITGNPTAAVLLFSPNVTLSDNTFTDDGWTNLVVSSLLSNGSTVTATTTTTSRVNVGSSVSITGAVVPSYNQSYTVISTPLDGHTFVLNPLTTPPPAGSSTGGRFVDNQESPSIVLVNQGVRVNGNLIYNIEIAHNHIVSDTQSLNGVLFGINGEDPGSDMLSIHDNYASLSTNAQNNGLFIVGGSPCVDPSTVPHLSIYNNTAPLALFQYTGSMFANGVPLTTTLAGNNIMSAQGCASFAQTYLVNLVVAVTNSPTNVTLYVTHNDPSGSNISDAVLNNSTLQPNVVYRFSIPVTAISGSGNYSVIVNGFANLVGNVKVSGQIQEMGTTRN